MFSRLPLGPGSLMFSGFTVGVFLFLFLNLALRSSLCFGVRSFVIITLLSCGGALL